MGKKKKPATTNTSAYQQVDDDGDSLLIQEPVVLQSTTPKQEPIFSQGGSVPIDDQLDDVYNNSQTYNNNTSSSVFIPSSSSNGNNPPNNNNKNDFDDDGTKVMTFEEAVEYIGFGWYQIFLMNICGAGWLFDGIELTMISFIIPQLTDEWSMTPVQAGSLGSAVFAGMMIGAWLGGIVSDKVGRKWIFCGSVFISATFGLASSFSNGYIAFIFLRFFVGLGLGAMVPVDFSLFMEFIPPKNRGAILGVLNIYWSIGAAFECLIAWICLQAGGFSLETSWRWVVALSSIPGFVIFISRLFVPESPRFNALRNKASEVHKVINTMAEVNCISRDDPKKGWIFRRSKWRLRLPKVEKQLSPWEQLKNLFAKDYILGSFLLWIIWFFMSFGGWGCKFLLPIVFIKLQNNNVYLNTFYVTGVGFISNIFTLFIIDRISRRALMSSTFIITGLLTAVVGISEDPIYVLVFSMLSNFFSSFPWAVVYTYTPEFYPTSFRATGMGTCSAFTRLAGTITPIVGEVLLKENYFIPFLVFGIAFFISGVAAIFLPRETLGQALEDVSGESHFLPNSKSHFQVETLGTPSVPSSSTDLTSSLLEEDKIYTASNDTAINV
ncbi:sugar transporter [Naegleria gruberi]|uniref:Sugar transporter n=1 Tax=Naegleria gruberi TaxID=5762 RepID=D2VQ75_NAEGR|nr:sugar transporter [Naegleria gruberi]EFC40996.1 sugar transporter [Naegleria gruberi]|eukprot:XP_002673740.1 sugar transporter [Naegleria gruberi strain NEG-M]